VYVILPIALAVIILTWLLLRRCTLIWLKRPTTVAESVYAGIAAWLFLLSMLFWFIGMVLTSLNFFATHAAVDIWAVLLSVMLTGFGAIFFSRSNSELGIDDTTDYIKEALQFRRSGQSRLDLISFIQERQSHRNQPAVENDHEKLQRTRLLKKLSKGKELEAQLALLREGTTVDIHERWRMQVNNHSFHPFCEKVVEVRIEPNRKRFSVIIDFAEFSETQLKDETTVLRFNRQVYDFLQSTNAEAFLKPYAPFFESYFLLCRAKRMNEENSEIFYPFMKAGLLVSELRRLEGFYFNPRKLSEIASIAFNHGAPV